jgi:glucokinase
MGALLADIGGTNTRCAVGDASGIKHVVVFRNDDFPALAAVLGRYLGELGPAERPSVAVLAVAAPIRGDEVHMLNRAWRFSREGLRRELALDRLEMLNDFGALAWALPALGAADLVSLGGGPQAPDAPRVVLGPGTGLGMATLVPVGRDWVALPGEGGHGSLAAQDVGEETVIRAVRERFGHCSAERLLSGPGLTLLHGLLHGRHDVAPRAIGDALRAGDPAAAATFGMFFRLLGTVAANAALLLGAFGGVYLGGGIVPRYVDALLRSDFRARFEDKGRYRDYLAAVPAWVITAENPALVGLLAFARSRAMA